MKKTAVARFAAVLTAAFVAVTGIAVLTTVKAEDDYAPISGGSTVLEQAPIQLNTRYELTFTQDKPEHWFSFRTTDRTDSTYRVKLVYAGGSLRDNAGITIYDEDNIKVKFKDGNETFYLNKGTSVASDETRVLSPDTTYYVALAEDPYMNGNHYVYNDMTQDMGFEIAENVALPKAVKLKAKSRSKKTVKLTWSEDDNADKYEVRYRRSGSWSLFEPTEDNELTISGLTSRKKYRFQVRGIREVDGTDMPGKWSKTVKVKVK